MIKDSLHSMSMTVHFNILTAGLLVLLPVVLATIIIYVYKKKFTLVSVAILGLYFLIAFVHIMVLFEPKTLVNGILLAICLLIFFTICIVLYVFAFMYGLIHIFMYIVLYILVPGLKIIAFLKIYLLEIILLVSILYLLSAIWLLKCNYLKNSKWCGGVISFILVIILLALGICLYVQTYTILVGSLSIKVTFLNVCKLLLEVAIICIATILVIVAVPVYILASICTVMCLQRPELVTLVLFYLVQTAGIAILSLCAQYLILRLLLNIKEPSCGDFIAKVVVLVLCGYCVLGISACSLHTSTMFDIICVFTLDLYYINITNALVYLKNKDLKGLRKFLLVELIALVPAVIYTIATLDTSMFYMGAISLLCVFYNILMALIITTSALIFRNRCIGQPLAALISGLLLAGSILLGVTMLDILLNGVYCDSNLLLRILEGALELALTIIALVVIMLCKLFSGTVFILKCIALSVPTLCNWIITTDILANPSYRVELICLAILLIATPIICAISYICERKNISWLWIWLVYLWIIILAGITSSLWPEFFDICVLRFVENVMLYLELFLSSCWDFIILVHNFLVAVVNMLSTIIRIVSLSVPALINWLITANVFTSVEYRVGLVCILYILIVTPILIAISIYCEKNKISWVWLWFIYFLIIDIAGAINLMHPQLFDYYVLKITNAILVVITSIPSVLYKVVELYLSVWVNIIIVLATVIGTTLNPIIYILGEVILLLFKVMGVIMPTVKIACILCWYMLVQLVNLYLWAWVQITVLIGTVLVTILDPFIDILCNILLVVIDFIDSAYPTAVDICSSAISLIYTCTDTVRDYILIWYNLKTSSILFTVDVYGALLRAALYLIVCLAEYIYTVVLLLCQILHLIYTSIPVIYNFIFTGVFYKDPYWLMWTVFVVYEIVLILLAYLVGILGNRYGWKNWEYVCCALILLAILGVVMFIEFGSEFTWVIIFLIYGIKIMFILIINCIKYLFVNIIAAAIKLFCKIFTVKLSHIVGSTNSYDDITVFIWLITGALNIITGRTGTITTAQAALGIFIFALLIILLILLVIRGGAPRYKLEQLTNLSYNTILLGVVSLLILSIILYAYL